MCKKWSVLFVLVALLLATVTGCADSATHSPLDTTPDYPGDTNTIQVESNETVLLGSGCSGKCGYYEVRESLIYFFDYKTNKRIVLCNKPNCAHNDASCNGFVAVNAGDDAAPHAVVSTAKFIFHENDSIYWFCSDGRVLKMNYDGTDHRQVATIDGKYGWNCAYKKGSIVYINAFYSVEEKHTIVEKSCFIVYDTNTHTWYQTKSYERNADHLLGLCENEVFYYHKSEFPPYQPGMSLEESINQANKNPCAVYKINLETGEKVVLCEKTEGEMSPVTMLNEKIYFHSRKEEAIGSLDPKTAEITLLAKGVTGRILFDKPIEGNLVFGRSKKIISEFDPDNDVMEVFNTKTNEVKEAYKLETNIGWNNGFRGVLAITPDSYIMIYKADFVVEERPGYAEPSVTGMTPYVGIIKKSDFWSGNYKFTEIQWF